MLKAIVRRVHGMMVALMAVSVVGFLAGSALAAAPQTSTFSFHHVNHDLFGSDPGQLQRCEFPVVFAVDVQGQETDFFDQTTRDSTRTVLVFHWTGTMTNPLNGKWVPAHSLHDQWTIYFEPDGSISKVVNNESMSNPYVPIHAHVVYDADENVLKDVGMDDLSYNKHPFSIQPLCNALS